MAEAPIPSNRQKKKAFTLATGDHLYDASRQTDQRRWIPDLNTEIYRNVSPFGRRTMATLGKWLYANNPVVRGAMNEMAWYSVCTWIPQYYGRNKPWGKDAEAWLFENDKICLLGGGTMLDYLMSIARAPYVEGDIATLYTETSGGYPKYQLIPGYRIRSDANELAVKEGQFKDLQIIDGVIRDEFGTAVGYRVYTDDTFRDVPASGIMLHFVREFDGQLRGLSQLACAAFDFQDVREAKDLEMAAQKLVASIGLIETNETGEADTAKKLLRGPVNGNAFNADGSKSKSYREIIEGVMIRYMKANTGSSLMEFKSDRPGVNSQNFKKDSTRDALQSLGWNYDFTLDPTKVGGVSGRICVTKINKTIQFIQSNLVRPASIRGNGYRVRKAIKLGDLSEDIDWWKLDYQGPAKLSADEKYSSDVAIQEIKAGLKTPQVACGERELWWEEVQDQLIEWEKRLQERCKEEGVDPNRIVLQTPNGNPASDQQPQPEPAQSGQTGDNSQ